MWVVLLPRDICKFAAAFVVVTEIGSTIGFYWAGAKEVRYPTTPEQS